ncbi:MAG TPA: aspartyl protease family protein [Steroidobacteraceae bacterium]|nr:aspartyl protease family protein [Steroidobacteraceae bacterium]
MLAAGASASFAVPLPEPAAATTPGAIPLPPGSATAPSADTPSAPAAAGEDSADALTPVIITAPEPRYVAPTRRDSIGRIWAPVYINGRGPFRLVLDSGATASEITAQVANKLGLSLDLSKRVMLRGVVGSASVPVVQVQSLTVGDLSFGQLRMPIVPDALGGADGILGTDGMRNQRILIDFNHDLINIARSHDRPAPPGYITIDFRLMRKELLVADAWVGDIHTKAIIDTGGQASIGNLALRRALERRRAQLHAGEATIEDVTRAKQSANDSMDAPPIVLGTGFKGSSVKITNDQLAFGDMHIFTHWNMTDEPAMLIGMDTLGRLGVLIIDYRRHELQLQLND